MTNCLTPRTGANNRLRLLAGAVLIVAQCLMMTGGCVQPGGGDTSGGGNSGGGGAGNGSGGGSGSGSGGPTTLNDLIAAWAVARGTGTTAKWGIAYGGSVTDDTLTLQVFLDGEQNAATLELTLSGDAISGTWTTTAASGTVSGTLNAAADQIVGTLALGGVDETLTLYKGARATYAANGVWNHVADGTVTIVAADLNTVLVSLLDNNDWTADGRYDGQYTATGVDLLGEAFSFVGDGVGGEGVFFDNGTKLVLVDRQNGGTLIPAAMRFDRTDNAGSRTGLWVGLDRQNAGDIPTRTIRRVVEFDGMLFVHESGAELDTALTRAQRLLNQSDDDYRDITAGAEWTGSITSSRNRVVGTFDGFDEWYNSMDRTATPTAADLTGTFGSHDINRQFSAVDPVTGSATLSYDGTTLNITDVGSDGNTYQMSATWQGDHFVGEWWDTAAPETRSPWRGQWLAEGGLLHGLWNEGEWSFSALPVSTTTEVSDAQVVYVADPATERVMTVVDHVGGSGLTMLRNQERITQMVYSTGTEEVTVTVDERLRPTQIVTSDDTIDIVWAANGTDIAVTVTDNGTLTEQTYNGTVDFSDAAVLALYAAQETATGRDFAPVRQWIADNPGELDRIARLGEMTAGAGASAKLRHTMQTQTEPYRVDLQDFTAVNNAAFQGSTFLLATASVLSGLGASTAIVAAVAGAAAVLALVVVGALLVDLLWWLASDGDCCTPCGLGCFFNCCWD